MTMDPFFGEIRIFGGTFAPRGWASCDGQLLPIVQNQPLFSILGTTYGGDGKLLFALPDLRGRAAIHASPEIPQGKGQQPVKVTSGDTAQPGYLALRFIIALSGVLPPR